MRHTTTVGEEFLGTSKGQEALDLFWSLIEDHYEEDWHVDQTGNVTLEVDDALLERVMTENFRLTPLGHSEWLKGTYIIKGIYAPDLSYLRGDYQKRTYFFVQEGF